MKNIAALILSGLLLSACSIKQEVTPLTEQIENNEICIVNNPAVRHGFIEAMQETLVERGYQPKVFDKNDTKLDACKYNLIYTANWKWDVALYLSYAKIDIIHKNRVIAAAIYDANNGQASIKKFINGEKKVKELINQIFPFQNIAHQNADKSKNAEEAHPQGIQQTNN